MVLSKKAERRLTTLIKYMRSLPKSANEHFDMRASWATHRGPHELPPEVTRKTLMDCGTTACAMGWAGCIPSFRRAGLKLRWVTSGDYSFAEFDVYDAQEFFDLPGDRFWDLFNDVHLSVDTTPKKWAARAAALVKEWKRG